MIAPDVGYLKFCVWVQSRISFARHTVKYLGIQHLPKRPDAIFGVEHMNFRVGREPMPSEDNAKNYKSVHHAQKGDVMSWPKGLPCQIV